MNQPEFAVEPLEPRLEYFCITVPYSDACSKRVWFVPIYSPGVKY